MNRNGFLSNNITRLTVILLAIGIPLLIVTIFARSSQSQANSNKLASPASNNSNQTLNKPLAEQPVNQEFSFALKNQAGEEVGRLRYIIEKAELRNEILVQGKKATALPGRAFLLFNIKIENPINQGIKLNTRDYLRLTSIGGSGEWLAPEIHNDPVEVQAISTKYTRVGFPVDSNYSEFILQVGELNGEKTQVPLTFSSQ